MSDKIQLPRWVRVDNEADTLLKIVAEGLDKIDDFACAHQHGKLDRGANGYLTNGPSYVLIRFGNLFFHLHSCDEIDNFYIAMDEKYSDAVCFEMKDPEFFEKIEAHVRHLAAQ